MSYLPITQFSVIACMVLLLAACGSGSGEKNSNTTNPSTQSIQSQSANSSVATSANTSANTSTNNSSVATQVSAPQNLVATPGNGTVLLSWNSVANATGYHVYYAAEANIRPANIASYRDGRWLQNVTSPQTITGLTNGVTYYFVVTAIAGQIESASSNEVSTTPTPIDLVKQPSAQEVLMVELINRARANPDAEATRHGVSVNDGVPPARLITSAPKQPLAHNLFLVQSARNHSQWMLDTDIFDHTGINGSSAGQRMTTAGYVFSGSWSNGENISWSGTRSSSINLTSSIVSQHASLFKSPGHRENILAENFRELGVGQKQGNFTDEGITYLASMVTQNFAKTGTQYFLTGVVYADTNSNRFYDVGEGLSGITVTVNGTAHLGYSVGAYAIGLAPGTYDVTITGDALGSTIDRRISITNANVKLDVFKIGNAIEVYTR